MKVESENFLRAAWGLNVWVAGSETNRNGVAIPFNSNFEYKVHSVVRDTDGCFIIMDIEIVVIGCVDVGWIYTNHRRRI